MLNLQLVVPGPQVNIRAALHADWKSLGRWPPGGKRRGKRDMIIAVTGRNIEVQSDVRVGDFQGIVAGAKRDGNTAAGGEHGGNWDNAGRRVPSLAKDDMIVPIA